MPWYCIHPGERTFDPEQDGALPEPDRCVHEECKPTQPTVELDATPDLDADTSGQMVSVPAIGPGPHLLRTDP
jgi:hypothetical protein